MRTNQEQFQLKPFSILSIGHMLNDFYANLLPQLLPVLITSAAFSITKATTMVSIFTVTSSLAQPVFGYLVDGRNFRWFLYLGTLWMAALLSIVGILDNYWLILGVVSLAGLGTAAFHPQAAANVSGISGKNKGLVMSTFIACGNMGLAMAPLLLLPYFNKYGVSASVYLVIPGLLAAIFLYLFSPRETQVKDFRSIHFKNLPWSNLIRGDMGKLIIMVALRSLVHSGIISLIPLYFMELKIPAANSGYLVSLTLFAGALGGMFGGLLSDRFGSKLLTVGSLTLATPLFYGFFFTQGLISYGLLALGAASLLASFSVTVVAAQEAFPDNKALASGLSLGFAIGTGGLAVGILGWFADHFGIITAIKLMFIIPLMAALFGLSLKGTKEKALR